MNKYILKPVLLCLLFLAQYNLSAQDKYSYLLHKTYAERVPLFDTVAKPVLDELSPADFDAEIDKIIALAKSEKDNGLLIEAKMAKMYNYKANKNRPSEKILNDIEQILAEAKELELKEYIILLRFELASYLFNYIHDYNRAFTVFIENYSELKDISEKTLPNKKAIVLHTGNAYYNFGDYVSAKKYLFIADGVKNSWRPRVNVQCKNTLGLLYRINGQYDSAIHYFEQGIEIAERSGLDIWVAIITGNIGISYYLQGDYAKAVPLLEKDVEECLDYGEFDNGINSSVKLVESYMHLGKLEEAEKVLQRAWRYTDSMKDRTKRLPDLFAVSSKLSRVKGQYVQALNYSDSADYYKNVIAKRDNIIQLARVQNRINGELHDKEIEKLTVEKELISTTRNGLILGLVLLSIITYLIINRQRIKHNAKQKLLLSEKQLAETKLKNASSELNNFTQRLQEKNAIIEKSAEEIERLQTQEQLTDSANNNNAILQQLYASTILTDDEWLEFKKLFDQVYAGYIIRLNEKMPGLTQADTRFIVLSKLKLSNKEMAGILGVQPDSIRTYKHRLRKKYNIPDEQSMSDIIDNI